MATPGDRTVRLFVSSTFRDMQAERLHLSHFVFPRVRRRLELREIGFCEIDLRWGITEQEARSGKVLPLCLAEIDRCAPFQICILGDRYGWRDPAAAATLQGLAPELLSYARRSVTELEIRYGVLNRKRPAAPAYFFYFRAPGAAAPDDRQSDIDARELADLKDEIRRSGYPVREGFRHAAELGDLVTSDLMNVVDEMFPPIAAGSPGARDWQAIVAPRTPGFLRRSRPERRLDWFAGTRRHSLLLLCGPTGVGKTTLLSQWLRSRLRSPEEAVLQLPAGGIDRLKRLVARLLRRRPDGRPLKVVAVFAASLDPGLEKTEHTWTALVLRVLEQVRAVAAIAEPLPTLIEDVPMVLGRWLALASAHMRLVVVLDGLDEVLPEDDDLSWLPAELPDGALVLVSAAPEQLAGKLRRAGWHALDLSPLTRRERLELTRRYLGEYGKRLAETELRQVVSFEDTANPLYLRTVLDQLRQTGVHETLGAQLSGHLGAGGLTGIFLDALERLETTHDAVRPGLVADALGLLVAARRGLQETELLDLLGTDGARLPALHWAPIGLALEPWLRQRNGLLAPASQPLHAAMEQRYFGDAAGLEAVRRRLVAYFSRDLTSPRCVQEVPWQLASLQDWESLVCLLCEPAFLGLALVRSPFDVASFWTILAARSAHRPDAAYRHLLERFEQHPRLVAAIAQLLGDLGYVETALTFAERLASTTLDASSIVSSLGTAATTLLEQRRFAEAAPILQRLLVLSRLSPTRQQEALVLDNLALLHLEEGQAEDALAMQQEAEALHRSFGNDRGLVVSLGIRAAALFRLYRTDEAVAQWRHQETQARLIGDTRALAGSLGNRARVLIGRGALDAAEPLCLEQERLCRRIGDQSGLLAALGNRVALSLAAVQLDDASAALDAREALAMKLHDVPARIASLCQRSDLSRRLGAVSLARSLLDEAATLARDSQPLPYDTQILLAAARAAA